MLKTNKEISEFNMAFECNKLLTDKSNVRIGSLALVLSMVSTNGPNPKRFSARMRNRYS